MKYILELPYVVRVRRPPHGGRGLKSYRLKIKRTLQGSPPARGAWIEITEVYSALAQMSGRPPHGGRGLKFRLRFYHIWRILSPPARGAWIEIVIFIEDAE